MTQGAASGSQLQSQQILNSSSSEVLEGIWRTRPFVGAARLSGPKGCLELVNKPYRSIYEGGNDGGGGGRG